MTIERFENGPRFCRVLRHNGTVYLAGLTADDLSGDTTAQTREILAKIDACLPRPAATSPNCSAPSSGCATSPTSTR